ncbi:hypothetical protein [Janthinobacterium lividum]|uniref:hypothetical protein n=1 Tax=Janthinobacterium lividum TaxID=29581 RepID=UPI001114E7D5|nr:hypothetical protein [Janthinobacterium lividum]
MRHTFVFSAADAQHINKKLMEQCADTDISSQSGPAAVKSGVLVSGAAARQARGTSLTFSAKEMNEAMTKARKLLAA